MIFGHVIIGTLDRKLPGLHKRCSKMYLFGIVLVPQAMLAIATTVKLQVQGETPCRTRMSTDEFLTTLIYAADSNSLLRRWYTLSAFYKDPPGAHLSTRVS